MTINGPTALANTYVPGIAAAIHRGDTEGATFLYHQALEDLHSLGLTRKECDKTVMWSMTAFATGMLRRAARDESRPVHEVVSEVADRQFMALTELIERNS